jgi:membrane protein implicated in regulation of membrane protease activity
MLVAIPVALLAVLGVMFGALGDTRLGVVIVLISFISLVAIWQWRRAIRRVRRRRWANKTSELS